ncbi:hypothetical protein WJX84_004171 [Apatococcus fuscideae]|uniref:HTH HARE-type domain-containing protein n=1 Tax=Apatococcus fuscideae TaxID=2026836 RepID=A0AAW1S603_9CHLO
MSEAPYLHLHGQMLQDSPSQALSDDGAPVSSDDSMRPLPQPPTRPRGAAAVNPFSGLSKRGSVPIRDETGRFIGVRPKTPAERMQKALTGSGGIFKSAAVAVLRLEKRLMATGEIARIALKRNLIKCQGKTPEATMASALYTDVKRKEGQSIFIRPHEGLFGLREWLEKGLPFQDPSDEMLEEVGAPQVKRVKFQEGQYTGEQQRYSRIAPFTAEEQAAAEMDEDELLQDGEGLEPSSPGDEPQSPSDRDNGGGEAGNSGGAPFFPQDSEFPLRRGQPQLAFSSIPAASRDARDQPNYPSSSQPQRLPSPGSHPLTRMPLSLARQSSAAPTGASGAGQTTRGQSAQQSAFHGKGKAPMESGNDGGMEEEGNIMLLLDAAKELHRSESGDQLDGQGRGRDASQSQMHPTRQGAHHQIHPSLNPLANAPDRPGSHHHNGHMGAQGRQGSATGDSSGFGGPMRGGSARPNPRKLTALGGVPVLSKAGLGSLQHAVPTSSGPSGDASNLANMSPNAAARTLAGVSGFDGPEVGIRIPPAAAARTAQAAVKAASAAAQAAAVRAESAKLPRNRGARLELCVMGHGPGKIPKPPTPADGEGHGEGGDEEVNILNLPLPEVNFDAFDGVVGSWPTGVEGSCELLSPAEMEAAENAAIDAAEAANALLLGTSPNPGSPTYGDGMLTGGEGDSSDGEGSAGQDVLAGGLLGAWTGPMGEQQLRKLASQLMILEGVMGNTHPQVGKAWLTLSKMYRAATDVQDGVAKAESALMRAWEILRHNQAGPASPVPAAPRPAHFVFPNVLAEAPPQPTEDQASGSFKYLLDTTRRTEPLSGELVASLAGLASSGLLQPTVA